MGFKNANILFVDMPSPIDWNSNERLLAMNRAARAINEYSKRRGYNVKIGVKLSPLIKDVSVRGDAPAEAIKDIKEYASNLSREIMEIAGEGS